MTDSVPSATTWGLPTANKHALLIHGVTSSSHTWHRVASSLAAQGYFVTAPDLLGHACRLSADSDYRFSAVVQDLRPYIEAHPYGLIIGHSWGAAVALSLFPHLPALRPIAIILVDPPIQASPERLDFLDALISESCIEVKSAEAYATENPLWTHQDCIYRELGTRLCAIDAVHGIFRQNRPWNFFHCFDAAPDKRKVTVLVADPVVNNPSPVKVDDLQAYPLVRAVVVPGSSHWIQHEFPNVIVEEALKRVAELDVP